MDTKQTEVGKYVACPVCNSDGRPLTRVELEFESGEQILWCGHHRTKSTQPPAPQVVAVPSHYEINVSRNGKHLFATHARSLTSRAEADKLWTLLDVKFPASEGYALTLTGKIEYGTIIPTQRRSLNL